MSKKTKTIDELLKEAIVSEERQRFKIPENWIWIRLGSITEIVGGGTPKSSIEEYYFNGHIPWLTPADLSGYKDMYIQNGRRNITELGLAKSSAKILPENTVLLSSRAPIGYVVIASNEVSTNQGFKSFVPSSAYYPQYLYWYLRFSTNYLESMASGTTFKELSGSKSKEISFPLPPLTEQKRIAEKVERLLGKIDEAKRLIEEAKETFELRRVAILDKAFSGELTAKWRKENKEVVHAFDYIRIIDDKRRNKLLPKEKPNYLSYKFERCVSKIEKLPSTWVQVPVGFLCDCIVPGRDKPKSFTGDIPWITIPDINQDYLNKSDASSYLSEKEIKEVKAKVIPSDSVVMSCVGRFGVSAIVNTPLVINQQLHAFLPSDMITSKYLMYHIRKLVPYMNEKATSTTISYLNKTNANSLPINVPPIEEQQKIVEILDNYFNRDLDAINLIENQLEQIEQIKASILSKAFQGELGTNDPSEESAIDLLKEVLQEQVK